MYLCMRSDLLVAVMGHIGLTPQLVGILGGFKPQGKGFGEREDDLDYHVI